MHIVSNLEPMTEVSEKKHRVTEVSESKFGEDSADSYQTRPDPPGDKIDGYLILSIYLIGPPHTPPSPALPQAHSPMERRSVGDELCRVLDEVERQRLSKYVVVSSRWW